MHKKISVGITASLVLIAITITFTATYFFAMTRFNNMISTSSPQREVMYERLVELDKIVQSMFFEEVDPDALYDGLINGYVKGLDDKDTVYLTADQVAEMEWQARGKSVGVGIEISKMEDLSGYFLITRIFPDSPADKALMGEGDRITKIDEEPVTSMTVEEGRALLSGTEGDSINLTYMHYEKDENGSIKSDGTPSEKNVKLSFTSLDAIAVDGMTIDNVYYIKIHALWDTARDQYAKVLAAAVNSYEANSVCGMVIDIRDVDNGINIEVVRDILNPLLPVGTLLSGIYRDNEVKVICTSDTNVIDIPVVVLINQKTSGYAEAIAAVLKDSTNCVGLVGTRTAGNGTLRQLCKLNDGLGLYISIALLKPPKSEPYHRIGVEPITEVKVSDDFVVLSKPNQTNDKQFAKAYEILQSFI